MRIFLTGASGFIGTAIIPELLGAGHAVVGLARSDAAAAKLAAHGIAVVRGDLVDLASLRAGAAASDGVVHCAFSHDDWGDREGNCAKDRAAIGALGDALAGSGRPLVVTAGSARFAPGIATEDREATRETSGARGESEQVALALAARGVRVSIVRLPPTVHGDHDHGFVPMIIARARELGRAGYLGDGTNRWPAVHVRDAARVFRLAVEQAPAGTRLHAVAEEGIAAKDIAAVIGRHLGVPVGPVAASEFGWLAAFWGLDTPCSSAATRARFGWAPREVGLLEDLERGTYF